MLNGKRPILRSLRALAAALGAVLALQAQTEPQLLTQTDTLDVYKSDAGKPTLVSVMDSMTGSRAVFEPSKYITMPTRAGWLGDKQGAIPFQDVFGNAFNVSTPRKSTDQVQAGKDLGFIFVLRSGTNEVYLLQWPNTKTLFRDDTGNVVMGHGYDFRSSFTPAGSAAVPYSTNDLNTIKQFTHVRFSVKIANGTTRTIDFPCPSQLFNSPYPFTSADAYNAGVAANVSSTSTGGIVYDLWSNRHGTLADMESNVDVVPYTNAQPARTGTAGTPGVAIQTALNATLDLGTTESNPYKWYTYVGIGNFFYSFDYFAWICGAQYVRNTTSDGLTAAPTTGIYASPSGYAVPDIGETVTYPTSISGNVASTSTGIAEGWKNGLPVMTRYQSMKVAAINVYSDFSGVITWVYRYLDAYVDNSANSEEGGGALSAASIPTNPDQSVIATDGTRANRMFVRALKLADLQSNTTSLQIMGPSGWIQTSKVSGSWQNMDLYDQGNKVNLDPRSPQPWSYALVNTYYRATVEMNPTIFPPLSTTCPGKTYVLIFPTLGVTDSKTLSTTQIPEDAASAYVTYVKGNSGLGKGSYTNLPASPYNLVAPGNGEFHPGVAACVAAFGDTSSNSGPWGAAWEPSASATSTRSSSNPGTQTMVISVGIPGIYKGAFTNSNTSNPQEHYFRIAQWSDPNRTDLLYGGWRQANGNPDDYSVLDTDPTTGGSGKVFYYYSTDPGALEQNWKNAIQHMVSGSAALSAPATPATGARSTTQAYFGIFNTSRNPIWSGNLYSVGLRTTINANGTESFSYYDANGVSTIGCIFLYNPDGTPMLDPSTGLQMQQCGLDDFNDHHLWSAFDLFAQYISTEVPPGYTIISAGVLGTPLLWSQRNVFTLMPGTTTQTNFSSTNTTLVATLVTLFQAQGYFPGTYTAAQKTQSVQDFLDYFRGKNPKDATKNRIGIVGDIINSAPLTVELSSTNLGGLTTLGVAWPTTGTNPHVRLILVGTNNGFLHAFAETAYTDASGNVKAKATEAWAFVPPDMLSTMYQMYINRTATDNVFRHRYLVDGSPALFWIDQPTATSVVGDTRVSVGEDAVVLFGMKKGGRSYYAFGISGPTTNGTPGAPQFLWKIDPLDPTSPSYVKKMGASSPPPVFGAVSTTSASITKQDVVYIPGGYANDEINARYRASGVIGAGEGMGQSMQVRNPITGAVIRYWDWSNSATQGAIAGAVTPVGIFPGSVLQHRIYFADFKGNVMSLGATATSAVGFRLDDSNINNWNLRTIYSNSAFRFTTRPDAALLSSDYPVPTYSSTGGPVKDIKPMTVMTSVGSGDWNNPTDAPEDFTVTTLLGTTAYSPTVPPTNRLYALADLQNSTSTLTDANLQAIVEGSWATSYSDTRVTIGNASYFMINNRGYYFALKDGNLAGATTHDKVLVSPLIKTGSLFFSIFDIQGNTGFGCASNAFTRTFRECDILRPLQVSTQVQASQTVADTNDLNRNQDSCNGLAFYFNSLGSELSDTGSRVIQGGAVSTTATKSFSQQQGANTPSIQSAKDTSTKRGSRLRSWRIVW